MGVGNPSYVTVISTGGGSSLSGISVSPWQKVDDFRNPVNLSFSLYSSSAAALSSGAFIQVTLDDPFGYYPHPLSIGGGLGAPSSAPFVSVLPSSDFDGTLTGSSAAPLTSFPAAGWLAGPITAWRVANSSTAGTVIATALQSGPR